MQVLVCMCKSRVNDASVCVCVCMCMHEPLASPTSRVQGAAYEGGARVVQSAAYEGRTRKATVRHATTGNTSAQDATHADN